MTADAGKALAVFATLLSFSGVVWFWISVFWTVVSLAMLLVSAGVCIYNLLEAELCLDISYIFPCYSAGLHIHHIVWKTLTMFLTKCQKPFFINCS